MIYQSLCDSFLRELPLGVHDFDSDTFKVALFKVAADIIGDYGASTTNYSQMVADEITGIGYTTTGQTVTGGAVATVNHVAVVDFADVVWPSIVATTRGALLYNASKAGAAVAVLDFGTDKFISGNTFTLRMPQPTDLAAFIRLRKQ